MLRNLLVGMAGVATLAFATSASAVVWTSNLEYRAINGAPALQSPFGTVTIEDGFDLGTTVKVSVSLAHADSLFVNTGGPHDPFLYNLVSPADVNVVNAAGQNFRDGGRTDPGAFEATPFGKFTNKIACCSTFVPEQTVVSGFHLEGSGKNKVKVLDYTTEAAHWVENNGQANGIGGPLVFYLHDAAGLTFAGLNFNVDPDTGKLLSPLGSGNHFLSNPAGWWFTADIYDGATKTTYNVAARDAFTQTTGAVPEPATWALMIMGFGAAGAMLRRRRLALA